MLICLDTETSGLDPAAGHAIVEIAMVPLRQRGIDWAIGPGCASLVAPGRRIDPGARAAHHITDEELRTAPHWPAALAHVFMVAADMSNGVEVQAIAAHNAEFDKGFVAPKLEPGDPLDAVPWLCTWKCARHLYPDAPGHSNQSLRYWLKGADAQVRALLPKPRVSDAEVEAGARALYRREHGPNPDWPIGLDKNGYHQGSNHVSEVPGWKWFCEAPARAALEASAEARTMGSLAPHRALYDAIVTAVLLKEMLKANSLDHLLKLQYAPVLLKTCNLPKHRGAPWSQVPIDYLRWIIRAEPPFDADTLHTARHYAGAK